MTERTIETDSFVVTFDDTPEVRTAVFEWVIKWYIEREAFTGECIMQSDDCTIEGPSGSSCVPIPIKECAII